MNTKDISHARNPDLRSSLTALRRASALARREAIRTGTDLVVVKDGKRVFIKAERLREEAQGEGGPKS